MSDQNTLSELLESAKDEANLTPKQAKIVESAIELFAEKGYASTSTSEIAKKAGVSEGTIFRHYPTKKELLMSIVKPVMVKFAVPFFMSKFSKEVFQPLPDTFEELLNNIIRNRFEFAKENQTLLKIFWQELAFHPELQKSVSDVAEKHIIPKFRLAIEKYKQEGQIADLPSESIIRLCITNGVGFLAARFLAFPGLDWDDEAEIERTVQFIVEGLHPD